MTLHNTSADNDYVAFDRFALHSLGRLRCFDQDHIDMYKEAVKNAFGTIDAATLMDMGVLAGNLPL